MTNKSPPSTKIIKAMTAMRSHEATLEREIAGDEAEIADKKAGVAEKKVELAKAKKGLRAMEEIFGPLPEETQPETANRGAGNRRTAPIAECPLTLTQRKEMGEKYVALYAIAEDMPDRLVHTRTVGKWLIEAALMPNNIDNARVALASYMRLRPDVWEPAGKGYFRLITPQTEAGSATQETGGETEKQEPPPFSDSST